MDWNAIGAISSIILAILGMTGAVLSFFITRNYEKHREEKDEINKKIDNVTNLFSNLKDLIGEKNIDIFNMLSKIDAIISGIKTELESLKIDVQDLSKDYQNLLEKLNELSRRLISDYISKDEFDRVMEKNEQTHEKLYRRIDDLVNKINELKK